MKLTSVLITGTSTGLGQALVAHYLKQGAQVYGLSRSGSRISHLHLRDARIDLGDLNTLKTSLAGLLEGIDQLDLVILNAGLLGQVEPMRTLEMDSLKDLMDVNKEKSKFLDLSDILAMTEEIFLGMKVLNENKDLWEYVIVYGKNGWKIIPNRPDKNVTGLAKPSSTYNLRPKLVKDNKVLPGYVELPEKMKIGMKLDTKWGEAKIEKIHKNNDVEASFKGFPGTYTLNLH